MAQHIQTLKPGHWYADAQGVEWKLFKAPDITGRQSQTPTYRLYCRRALAVREAEWARTRSKHVAIAYLALGLGTALHTQCRYLLHHLPRRHWVALAWRSRAQGLLKHYEKLRTELCGL